jgi:signal transduction histidine kinase
MKPAPVYTLFAICLAVVVFAMAWSSAIVLRLERAEVQAQAQAALEENARLALWRMDSALAPLLAQESARPYFHYAAFYAAGGSYARMLGEPSGGHALQPSPLLLEAPVSVLLYFQLRPGGALTSPQVPEGALRARALREGRTTRARLAERGSRLRELRALLSPAQLLARLPREEPRTRVAVSPPASRPRPDLPLEQKLRNVKEFEVRQQSLESSTQRVLEQDQGPPGQPEGELLQGAMTALWAGQALLLARRVRVNDSLYLQGCWLAWPRLRDELLASVRDLLPSARLEPLEGGERADDERRLAALPVRLEPGSAPQAAVAGLSPIRLSLLGAWACLLLAALSVAALLGGVLTLSERRRIFVSAVTHELRTPLTTFRLYTDMLAEGMVGGEHRRREYLSRLRSEAERLGHLVENVLFYSRVESGRAGARREAVNLVDALEAAWPRLVERARSAGLRLTLERGEAPMRVVIDRAALEQVLLNLVDNACKHASASEPPLVHVELGREAGRALIRVRDHGAGLSRASRRRLFRPFSKSDREAATQGPGVGLGLALSRRLMRAQRADLTVDDSVTEGAAFVISLPLGE